MKNKVYLNNEEIINLEKKYKRLKERLESLNSAVIGFSGGVDSTFLLKVSADVLGNNVLALTARSSTYPEREYREAVQYAKDLGVKHESFFSDELEIPGFSDNPIDRCYHCKKELFLKINEVAKKKGYQAVLDGANYDDVGDYRPGMEAAKELGVVSPLKEVEMTKLEIRFLSERMGLPTWDKPAFACLASRFPYGSKITKEKLQLVEKAEIFMRDLGFKQVRVRHHGSLARIEVAPEEREKLFDIQLWDEIGNAFKVFGFTYATVDVLGYRTGSMNDTISIEGQKNTRGSE